MHFYIQQELDTKGHGSIDVVMTKGPRDYHLAFEMARPNAIVESIKKN